MPKLWSETVQDHRSEVRDAVLDVTAELVAAEGLLAVSMSRIAEAAGIGRATLYKYFPDAESVLLAWHERQVGRHLEELRAAREQAAGPGEALQGVLTAYARICQQAGAHHHAELATVLHRHAHAHGAQQQLQALLRDVLVTARDAELLRTDASPEELLTYCQHALAGAADLHDRESVGRLVELTISGLRPPR